MSIQHISIVSVVSIGLAAVGCQNKKPTAQIESSADLASYAERYPGDLSAQMTRYTDDANRARDSFGGFQGYPDALSEPDWAVVAEVYEAADAEGRGYGYARSVEETRVAGEFFEREKDDINRRVNGTVKNAAEKAECKCELDVYGKVSYALKESVERRLEEQLKASNHAFTVIDRNEKSLGKKNTAALEEQAAAISYAAYVVYIEMPTLYSEVERRLDEVKDVRKTLEAEIAIEKARLEAAKGRAEKKIIGEHLKALESAKSAIDIYEQEAKQLVSQAELDIPKIRKAYEEAFDKLLKDVKERQKAAPPVAATP